MRKEIQFVECPRDAMQGWPSMIATTEKVRYLNALLKVGFHTLDFGSFVSPIAIPQMADTKEVIPQLQLNNTNTKLLAIVANERGAADAVAFDEISYLGYPFSISETFQLRNTNATIEESLSRVEAIQSLCVQHQKELVVYLSMGFGNPYGDLYNEEIVEHWARKLAAMDIRILSLADTVGVASAAQVHRITKHLIQAMPDINIGVHLHASPYNWKDKIEAAYTAGCTRFDGALKGIGGCPMASDDLVGNMDSENMIAYLQQQGEMQRINMDAMDEAVQIANEIFVK